MACTNLVHRKLDRIAFFIGDSRKKTKNLIYDTI